MRKRGVLVCGVQGSDCILPTALTPLLVSPPSGLHHRYFNLSGAHAIMATTNNADIMAMYTLIAQPPAQALRRCADLAPLIPPGEHGVGAEEERGVEQGRRHRRCVGGSYQHFSPHWTGSWRVPRLRERVFVRRARWRHRRLLIPFVLRNQTKS